MKICHVVYRFFPERGGSETYVYGLIRELLRSKIKNFVISAGKKPCNYKFNSINIENIGNPFAKTTKNENLIFEKINHNISTKKPDILHFHWIPDNAEKILLQKNCPPAIFTLHHINALCPRGDLLEYGSKVCNGYLNKNHCFPCILHKKGIPKTLAILINKIPAKLFVYLANKIPTSKLKTFLLLNKNIEKNIDKTLQFLFNVKKIIVLSLKCKKVLLENKIPPKKIKLVRIGFHHRKPRKRKWVKTPINTRGIYVGRICEQKGLKIICEALEQEAPKNIKIDIYGPSSDLDEKSYLILDRIKKNLNLSFRGLLKDDYVVRKMAKYDFSLIPSQTIETGPFFVVESLQAKIPIIGSDVSGINEMVKHDRTGYLIPLSSLEEWKKVFRKINNHPECLSFWKKRIKWNWTMADVGHENLKIYLSLTEKRGH